MKIIGLTGYARSGKDTAAGIIRAELALVGQRVDLLAFAAPLKAFCADVFGFSYDQLYGDGRDDSDPRWTRPNGDPLTARFALQTLGTEWGRQCDADVWVKSGLRRAAASLADVCVFTDVRFINEASAVRKAGGEVWRVQRGEGWHMPHESEVHIFSPEMTRHVTLDLVNQSSLADLRSSVRTALASRGILP